MGPRARPRRLAPLALRMALRMAVCAVALAPTLAVTARPAHAQTADELAAARTLFGEALKDQDARRFDVALEKFRRVQQVRDTAPIRYRMGMCHEALGQLGQAQASYQAAVELAGADRAQDEVFRAARARIDAIWKRVPRLALALTGRPVSDIEVRVDDRVIPAAVVREPVPVDPGEHVITASAPGAKPFRTVVSLPEGALVALTIPMDPPPGNPPGSAAPPPVLTPSAPVPERGGGGGGGPQRVLGVVAVAGGAALIAGGVVLAVLRAAAITDIQEACPGGACPRATRSVVESARDRAQLFGPLGVGLAAGGAVAAGAGIWLLVTAPNDRAASVTPLLGPGLAGAALSGQF